ncbi:methyl-accepting chemotaxis protein [Vibrio salinus]|uniref:methyl-accepting chemotaxis protein n=1 Tax=Vibrio salinus TaxID=2899784 RepID=UPI001E33A34B|nr:methyl-accepting chemotaxis protein [Vibrio salinus]MCE0492540.1 methyl-accepting chemotaxis protein [Vibrio salinus]
MKFKQKVVAASSLILVLSLSSLSFHQLGVTEENIESFVNKTIKESVSSVNKMVHNELSAKESMAKMFAETISLNPLNKDYVYAVASQPELKSKFIGSGIGYQRDGSIVKNGTNKLPKGYDPRKRPWYKQAVQEKKLIVTKPFASAATKEMIISIAVPIYQSGQLVGSTFFNLSLSDLSTLVNSVNLFDAGHLFLVSNTGITITYPDKAYVGRPLTDFLPNVQLKAGMQNFELDGKNFLINFTRLPGKDWYVGAIVNKDIAFKALTKLRNDAVIYTLLGVIVSIIILTILMNYLMRPLSTLNIAIQDIASGRGDLTRRLNTNLDQEFSELSFGFNQFTSTLQQQIQQSKAISQDILSGITNIVKSTDQSSDDMHSQMQEVDQLATAMNEMAATASDVSNNAQGAASAAKEADEASVEGTEVVTYTTTSIYELSERISDAVEKVRILENASNNIETILKVINDIADQTNLLALNAAIEAARAGDSGRGFAVVADEVRTLAQRTQKSTTEIRTMIEQLQSGTASVSRSMEESMNKATESVEQSQVAQTALGKIRTSIQHINDMNVQIASAAEEQSLVAEEINANMLKIKEISENVLKSADDVKVATQSQADKTNKQEEILGQFIV